MQSVYQLLVIGLDGSGKTSIIKHLKQSTPNVQQLIYPTPFVNIEKIPLRGKTAPCIVYDLSGQGRYRHSWSYFYSKVDGIFFVIDSTDTERLSVAKQLLDSAIKDPCLKSRRIPFLIICNKIDLNYAIKTREIMQILELDKIKIDSGLKIDIKRTSGFNGVGTAECLSFFVEQVRGKK